MSSFERDFKSKIKREKFFAWLTQEVKEILTYQEQEVLVAARDETPPPDSEDESFIDEFFATELQPAIPVVNPETQISDGSQTEECDAPNSQNDTGLSGENPDETSDEPIDESTPDPSNIPVQEPESTPDEAPAQPGRPSRKRAKISK